MRRLTSILTASLLTATLAFPAFAAPAAQNGDTDCADYTSQAAAQQYFDSEGYSATNDPERLDADNDGIPCEGNPSPYSDEYQNANGTQMVTDDTSVEQTETTMGTPSVPSEMPHNGAGGMRYQQLAKYVGGAAAIALSGL